MFQIVTHFVQDKNFKGTVPLSNLKTILIIFIAGRKKLVNVGSKNMFTKQDNSLKHCIQSITKKLRSTLSLKIETETKNTTVPFSKEDKSKYSSRVKCISRKIAWASKDFNQLGPLSPKNMVSLLSCSMQYLRGHARTSSKLEYIRASSSAISWVVIVMRHLKTGLLLKIT